MPYTIENPPDIIKGLPQGAKRIWIEAFNAAYKEYGDEQKAIATAWAAVKREFYKDEEGNWVVIESQKSGVRRGPRKIGDFLGQRRSGWSTGSPKNRRFFGVEPSLMGRCPLRFR